MDIVKKAVEAREKLRISIDYLTRVADHVSGEQKEFLKNQAKEALQKINAVLRQASRDANLNVSYGTYRGTTGESADGDDEGEKGVKRSKVKGGAIKDGLFTDDDNDNNDNTDNITTRQNITEQLVEATEHARKVMEDIRLSVGPDYTIFNDDLAIARGMAGESTREIIKTVTETKHVVDPVLVAKNSELKTQNDQLTDEKKVLTDEKNTLIKASETIRNANITLTNNYKTEKEKVNRLNKEMATIRKTLAAKERELADVTKSLAAFEELHKNNLFNKEASLEKMQTSLSEKNNEIRELTTQLDEIRSTYETIIKEKQRLESRLVQLEHQQSLNQNKYNILLKQKQKLKEEKLVQEKLVQEKELALSKLKKEITDLTTTRDTYQKKSQEYERKSREYEQNIRSLQQQIKEIKSQHEKQMSEMAGNMKKVKDKISQLERDGDILKNANINTQTNSNNEEELISLIDHQKSINQEEINRLTNEMKKMSERMTLQTEQHDEEQAKLIEELDRIKNNMLTEKQQMTKEYDEKIKELNQKIVSLQTEYKDVVNTNSELQTTADEQMRRIEKLNDNIKNNNEQLSLLESYEEAFKTLKYIYEQLNPVEAKRSFRKKYDDESEKLSAQIDWYQKNIIKDVQSIRKIQDEYDKMKSDMIGYRNKADRIEIKLSNILKEQDKLKKNVDELTKRIDSLKLHFQNIKYQVNILNLQLLEIIKLAAETNNPLLISDQLTNMVNGMKQVNNDIIKIYESKEYSDAGRSVVDNELSEHNVMYDSSIPILKDQYTKRMEQQKQEDEIRKREEDKKFEQKLDNAVQKRFGPQLITSDQLSDQLSNNKSKLYRSSNDKPTIDIDADEMTSLMADSNAAAVAGGNDYYSGGNDYLTTKTDYIQISNDDSSAHAIGTITIPVIGAVISYGTLALVIFCCLVVILWVLNNIYSKRNSQIKKKLNFPTIHPAYKHECLY